MTWTSFPFAAGAGSSMSQPQWEQLFSTYVTNGVAHGQLNELQVYGDSSGMHIKIMSGQANINGTFFQDDGNPQTVLPISNNTDPSNNRIDLVVLRLNPTGNVSGNTGAYSIGLDVVTGTTASSPLPPGLTQISGGVWEIPLAQVLVTHGAVTIASANVNDVRQYVAPKGAQMLNLLTNGGIEEWHRGLSFTCPTGAATYTSDRWIGTGNAPAGVSLTVSQENTVVDFGSYTSMKVVIPPFTTGNLWIQQNLPVADGHAWPYGMPVTFSARVNCSSIGICKAQINENPYSVVSPANKTIGTWETISISNQFPLSNQPGGADGGVLIVFNPVATTQTVYIDNCMFAPSTVVSPFSPQPPQADYERTLRYYERIGEASDGILILAGYAGAANQRMYFTLPFKVTKVLVPTITVFGTWSASGAGQVSTVTANYNEMQITYLATGAGNCYIATAPGAYISLESNV